MERRGECCLHTDSSFPGYPLNISCMLLTVQQLKYIAPRIKLVNLDIYVPLLNQYMDKYQINTKARIAPFLANVAHESAQFNRTEEIASGEAYEGRVNLGNTQPGDGKRFKGRGLIQTTGRSNYKAVSDALKIDFVVNPWLLEKPAPATESACWFWAKAKGLNTIADYPDTWIHPGAHKYSKFQYIVLLINGGQNGFAERLDFLHRANEIL